jgi:hypothetical protein
MVRVPIDNENNITFGLTVVGLYLNWIEELV